MQDREPRSFGLSVGSVAGLVAVCGLWRERPSLALVPGVFAAVLLGAALLAPAWLRRPSAVWMRVARWLAWVNTRLLLSAMFLLVLTPVGVLRRFAGRDSLGRRSRGAPTGWVPYSERR